MRALWAAFVTDFLWVSAVTCCISRSSLSWGIYQHLHLTDCWALWSRPKQGSGTPQVACACICSQVLCVWWDSRMCVPALEWSPGVFTRCWLIPAQCPLWTASLMGTKESLWKLSHLSSPESRERDRTGISAPGNSSQNSANHPFLRWVLSSN